jgi:hypothetical protein
MILFAAMEPEEGDAHIECLCLSDRHDIPPYLASLLKRRGIPEKPVYSTLLDSLLPFFLCAFCFKLALGYESLPLGLERTFIGALVVPTGWLGSRSGWP